MDSVTELFSVTATDGKILKSDVSVAKNYLREEELKELGLGGQRLGVVAD